MTAVELPSYSTKRKVPVKEELTEEQLTELDRDYEARWRADMERAKKQKAKEAEELQACQPPESKTAAPLCQDAAVSNDLECQLGITTTINDNCCQEEVNLPKRKPEWKKLRRDKQRPRPVKKDLAYLHIYMGFHPSHGEYSWSEAVILSEITYLMQRKGGANPCYASVAHLASIGGVCLGTAKNILKRRGAAGVIVTLGYHTKVDNGKVIKTRERVIAPEHSAFPDISRRLIKASREKTNAKR